MQAQTLDASEGRRSLSAFLVSGMLMAFLGAILPVWRYHLQADFREVGYYFLSLNIGILLSVAAAQVLLPRKGVKFMLIVANAVACGGFLFLAVASPPVAPIWRLAGVLFIGIGAGLLNAGVFQAISPLYLQNPAATVNLAGVLFGLGCLLTAVLVAGTYFAYNVPSILILLALVPGFYAGICARAKLPREPVAHPIPVSQVLRDFRNPGAILFSLVLFFQFGNEWSMAGWLPLLLIRRLGISPAASLLMLALFWLALIVGRIVSQVVMKRMSHAMLLLGSIVSALLGTIVLASTNNVFGSVMGILLVGAGYASIYPLVVEKIGYRFPYYHPGIYNGLFSLAITGGLLAPWTLGYFTQAWGIQAVTIIPMFGIIMVFVLVLLVMLEAKLSGLSEVRGSGS
ncbi:MAG TPA: MFS transporter [Bryobacteraceae bacterium]|nr:MFS transporter [Bryobacteraceae bacterium]